MGKIVLCEEKHEVSTASAEQKSRKRTTASTARGVLACSSKQVVWLVGRLAVEFSGSFLIKKH